MEYLGAAVPVIFSKHKGAWGHSKSTLFGKEGGETDRKSDNKRHGGGGASDDALIILQ